MSVTLTRDEALEILEAIRPILKQAANRPISKDGRGLNYNETVRGIADHGKGYLPQRTLSPGFVGVDAVGRTTDDLCP